MISLPRDRRRDERGFTATEMILVVVLLGLISVPLLMALMQAVRVGPESGARTEASVDRMLLGDTFSSDVARAESVTFLGGGAWCTDQISWPNMLRVEYKDPPLTGVPVVVTYKPLITGAGLQGTKAQVIRVVTVNGTETSNDVVAEGYCDITSQPLALGAGVTTVGSNRRAYILVNLRPTPRTEIEPVSFEASTRATM